MAGVVGSCLVASALGHGPDWRVLAAAVVLGAVGFLDDVRGLPAVPRMAAQLLVGAALGASVGGPALAVVGAALMVICVNVVNFMDGINGISALHTTLWGCTAALVLGGAVPALAVSAAAVAGAALAFLPFNAPSARLFLGDSGSYFIGALVASTALAAWPAASGQQLVVLALPLLLYFVDTFAVLVRRSARGASLLEAHREHVYQQLANEGGLPPLAVVVPMVLASAGVTLLAARNLALGLVAAVVAALAYTLWPQFIGTRRPR